jgi:hypothetical protein
MRHSSAGNCFDPAQHVFNAEAYSRPNIEGIVPATSVRSPGPLKSFNMRVTQIRHVNKITNACAIKRIKVDAVNCQWSTEPKGRIYC